MQEERSKWPWFMQDPLAAIEVYKKADNYVVLDVETTNKDFGSAVDPENELLLACWDVVRDGEVVRKSKWGDEYEMAELEADIKAADFLVTWNCFTGDTEYVTREGVRSFNDSVGETVEVWNAEGWQKAEVKKYGKSKVVELELAPYNRSRSSITRRVRATPNHRWEISRLQNKRVGGKLRKVRQPLDGTVTTAGLQVGDTIKARRVTAWEPSEEGLRHGIVFGDGNRSSSNKHAYQIRLCGWKEIYKSLFPKYSYPPSAGGDPMVGYYKSFIDLKALPPADASPAYIAGFIEGWQRMDGTSSGNGGSRTVDTTDGEAAAWLVDNAHYGGWFVTGSSEHWTKSGYRQELIKIYKVVLTKDPEMLWTVRSKTELEEEQDVFCVEVDGLDRFTLAHGIYTANCKFELGWLRRCGLDLHNILSFDGYLAEWVIQSNRFRKNTLGLDATSQRYGLGQKLDRVSYLIGKGFCPSEIPAEWLEEYCFKDVELTRLVFEKQLEVLHKLDAWHLVLTRNLLVPVLADMEFSPQHLDKEEVNRLYEQKVNEFIALENKLGTFTDGINLNSPKQKAEFLYDKMGFVPPKDKRGNPVTTKTGNLSTDAATLALLKPKNKRQREFLELYEKRNKLNTELTKNLSFFKAAVEELDGKFYGIFNQGFTDTGRLSSSGRKVYTEMLGKEAGSQLQNLPRDYKYLFTTHDKDTEVWSWDAAQLEFRVAANVGDDPVATEEIITGFDVHSYTAQVLTDAGEPTNRQEAKASTFAPLYGGGGRSKAQMEYAKAFKQKYAGISSTQEGWTHRVLKDKELALPWGMRFYWPNTSMKKSGYIDNTTQIYNYPIQSLATAEIIPLALVFFWHYTKDVKVELFNTVHDSIVARVHKDVDEEWLKEVIVHSMTHDVFAWLGNVYGYEMTVPLGVGLKIGEAWDVSDVEHAWDVTPTGDVIYKEK